MDRIPPIARRSRWEPPISPGQPEPVERKRREPAREEERKRRPRPPQRAGENHPEEDQREGPHIDTRA